MVAARRQALRPHRHPRQQRGRQLHLPRRGSVAERLERRHRHRAERHLLLLARRRPPHDRARQGRVDRVDPRELRLDRQRRAPIHSAAAKAGVHVDDADARRRMGAPRDSRQRRRARPIESPGAAKQLWNTPEAVERITSMVPLGRWGQPRGSRRRRRVPGLGPQAGFITGETLTIDGGAWLGGGRSDSCRPDATVQRFLDRGDGRGRSCTRSLRRLRGRHRSLLVILRAPFRSRRAASESSRSRAWISSSEGSFFTSNVWSRMQRMRAIRPSNGSTAYLSAKRITSCHPINDEPVATVEWRAPSEAQGGQSSDGYSDSSPITEL